MSMTQTELAIIKRALDALSGDSASDKIKTLLNDHNMRLFLDTWVRGPLQSVISHNDGELTLGEIKFWARYER